MSGEDDRTCVFRSEWAHRGKAAAAPIWFIASASVSLSPSLSFNITFPSIIAFVCLILSLSFSACFPPLHLLHLSPAHIHPFRCLRLHSSIAISLSLSVCLLVLTIHHIISCLIIIAVMSSRQHRHYLQWQALCSVVGSSKQTTRPLMNFKTRALLIKIHLASISGYLTSWTVKLHSAAGGVLHVIAFIIHSLDFRWSISNNFKRRENAVSLLQLRLITEAFQSHLIENECSSSVKMASCLWCHIRPDSYSSAVFLPYSKAHSHCRYLFDS